MDIHGAVYAFVFGDLYIADDGNSVTRITLSRPGTASDERRSALTDDAAAQIGEYLSGRRRSFDLPLRLGGTPFQQKIWRALTAVPYGGTISYSALASAAGHPRAARAAGSACGANPLLIVIPCHRAVAAGGMGGFSAGLPLKQFLLNTESRNMTPIFDAFCHNYDK